MGLARAQELPHEDVSDLINGVRGPHPDRHGPVFRRDLVQQEPVVRLEAAAPSARFGEGEKGPLPGPQPLGVPVAGTAHLLQMGEIPGLLGQVPEDRGRLDLVEVEILLKRPHHDLRDRLVRLLRGNRRREGPEGGRASRTEEDQG